MAEQGRNTNFVAVSLIGHGALVAGATIWNQTELLAVLAPWPLLRVFFLHGSVKPGVLTATQPQDASEVSEQHFRLFARSCRTAAEYLGCDEYA
jgi:hypothetical protein